MARLVAVTGATGFIGGHVVGALARNGARVRILARRLPDHPFMGAAQVDLVHGDLEDTAALRRLVEGADAVVHMAGVIKARRRDDFFRYNARAVERLAAVLLEGPSSARLVYVSSLAAREPGLSAYAASKRAGEACLARDPRLRWSIIRPPAVYGPGDRETLRLFQLAARGLAPILAPSGARLSLIDVRDLARAIAALALSAKTARTAYEIDDGRIGGYAWADIVEAAGHAVGRPVRAMPMPPAASWMLAALGDLARVGFASNPMLTTQKLREIRHADWVVSDRRLQEELGWTPEISLQQGFAEAVAWYRSSNWL